jgi:hypothetical protein
MRRKIKIVPNDDEMDFRYIMGSAHLYRAERREALGRVSKDVLLASDFSPHIAFFLGLKDLVRMSRVCKGAHQAFRDTIDPAIVSINIATRLLEVYLPLHNQFPRPLPGMGIFYAENSPGVPVWNPLGLQELYPLEDLDFIINVNVEGEPLSIAVQSPDDEDKCDRITVLMYHFDCLKNAFNVVRNKEEIPPYGGPGEDPQIRVWHQDAWAVFNLNGRVYVGDYDMDETDEDDDKDDSFQSMKFTFHRTRYGTDHAIVFVRSIIETLFRHIAPRIQLYTPGLI